MAVRAFEAGDPGLDHALGGVHDAGVDVADLGQREQVGGVVAVAELVRGGLVDRHGPGPGGRVGLRPGVDLAGVEAPLVAHRVSSFVVLMVQSHAPEHRPESRPIQSGFREAGARRTVGRGSPDDVTPCGSTSSTCTRPGPAMSAARTPASSAGASAAMLGPDPDSHAASTSAVRAGGPQPPGRQGGRPVGCPGAGGPRRPRAGTDRSPDGQRRRPTARPDRPRTPRRPGPTRPGSARRDASVAVDTSGDHTITATSDGTGSETTRPPAATTKPP